MAIRAEGHITRMYVNSSGCNLRLDNKEEVPKDGYFILDLQHPNYNAIYSLLLLAATNGYVVSVRTKQEIGPNAAAEISYVVADW